MRVLRRRDPHATLGRLLQASIAAIVVVGLLTRNLGVVVNGAVALALTFLPAAVARDRRLALSSRHALVVTTVLLLHTVGMLGLYDRVWWWDHLTHTFSAALVAAVGYVAVRVVDEHSAAIYLPRDFLVAFVVLGTLALGVAWELVEYAARELTLGLGLDPVLVVYGLEDTIVDLVFDTVGAVVVSLFATRRLEHLVDRFVERVEETTRRG